MTAPRNKMDTKLTLTILIQSRIQNMGTGDQVAFLIQVILAMADLTAPRNRRHHD